MHNQRRHTLNANITTNITTNITANINTTVNYNHVLQPLQDYMLDATLLSKNSTNESLHEAKKNLRFHQNQEQKQSNKEPEKFFMPKEKDKLFWCYYIIHNGFAKYEYPGVTSFVNEKTEKFKCIEMMRMNKQQLKIKKIKNIKEDVEDELANKQTIGMKTFIALCVASNINIMYIHRRKCFEIIFDDLLPVNVVHCISNSDSSGVTYSYEIAPTNEEIELYRTSLFAWESVDKPLKAISSYKLDELQKIVEALGFEKDSMKMKTKKDLYEFIIMNL